MVREPIPLARWLLAPWRTFLLWRRMALWQITSYRTAVDAELQVRHAVTAESHHWIDTGRPTFGDTLRQRLHVSAVTSRELTRAVRAADRAAVIAAGGLI